MLKPAVSAIVAVYLAFYSRYGTGKFHNFRM